MSITTFDDFDTLKSYDHNTKSRIDTAFEWASAMEPTYKNICCSRVSYDFSFTSD